MERLSIAARFMVWLRTCRCRDLGRAGERAAEAFLASRGLVTVARNWRGRHGELDLVAVAPDNTLVVVEVKTTTRAGAEAWSRLDAAKQSHLERTVHEYLRAHGLELSRAHRIDALVVTGDPRKLARPLGFDWVIGGV